MKTDELPIAPMLQRLLEQVAADPYFDKYTHVPIIIGSHGTAITPREIRRILGVLHATPSQRDAARLVVDAEYRREQWGSDTVATFDRAIQGLRERLK